MDEYSTAMDDWISQCNAYILTYMITARESFDIIKDLISRVEVIKRTKKIPMVIVGNKKDINARLVPEEEARQFSESCNIQFLETSAKTGENISKMFDVLISEYLRIKKEIKEESAKAMDEGNQKELCKCTLI